MLPDLMSFSFIYSLLNCPHILFMVDLHLLCSFGVTVCFFFDKATFIFCTLMRGGSPSLVARGFGMVQAAGTVEQVLMQVPNQKVGVIIGKGGETIKNLQTRSGARIQLIPQHLPDGDQSKERTVRVAGDKKQIEMAREMIKEVMNQGSLL